MILELIDTITTTDLNKILFLAYTYLQSHITSQKSLPAKEFSKTNTKTIRQNVVGKHINFLRQGMTNGLKLYITQSHVQ